VPSIIPLLVATGMPLRETEQLRVCDLPTSRHRRAGYRGKRALVVDTRAGRRAKPGTAAHPPLLPWDSSVFAQYFSHLFPVIRDGQVQRGFTRVRSGVHVSPILD
jgi:hypothetical protein